MFGKKKAKTLKRKSLTNSLRGAFRKGDSTPGTPKGKISFKDLVSNDNVSTGGINRTENMFKKYIMKEYAKTYSESIGSAKKDKVLKKIIREDTKWLKQLKSGGMDQMFKARICEDHFNNIFQIQNYHIQSFLKKFTDYVKGVVDYMCNQLFYKIEKTLKDFSEAPEVIIEAMSQCFGAQQKGLEKHHYPLRKMRELISDYLSRCNGKDMIRLLKKFLITDDIQTKYMRHREYLLLERLNLSDIRLTLPGVPLPYEKVIKELGRLRGTVLVLDQIKIVKNAFSLIFDAIDEKYAGLQVKDVDVSMIVAYCLLNADVHKIGAYLEYIKHFKARGRNYPVVMLFSFINEWILDKVEIKCEAEDRAKGDRKLTLTLEETEKIRQKKLRMDQIIAKKKEKFGGAKTTSPVSVPTPLENIQNPKTKDENVTSGSGFQDTLDLLSQFNLDTDSPSSSMVDNGGGGGGGNLTENLLKDLDIDLGGYTPTDERKDEKLLNEDLLATLNLSQYTGGGNEGEKVDTSILDGLDLSSFGVDDGDDNLTPDLSSLGLDLGSLGIKIENDKENKTSDNKTTSDLLSGLDSGNLTSSTGTEKKTDGKDVLANIDLSSLGIDMSLTNDGKSGGSNVLENFDLDQYLVDNKGTKVEEKKGGGDDLLKSLDLNSILSKGNNKEKKDSKGYGGKSANEFLEGVDLSSIMNQTKTKEPKVDNREESLVSWDTPVTPVESKKKEEGIVNWGGKVEKKDKGKKEELVYWDVEEETMVEEEPKKNPIRPVKRPKRKAPAPKKVVPPPKKRTPPTKKRTPPKKVAKPVRPVRPVRAKKVEKKVEVVKEEPIKEEILDWDMEENVVEEPLREEPLVEEGLKDGEKVDPKATEWNLEEEAIMKELMGGDMEEKGVDNVKLKKIQGELKLKDEKVMELEKENKKVKREKNKLQKEKESMTRKNKKLEKDNLDMKKNMKKLMDKFKKLKESKSSGGGGSKKEVMTLKGQLKKAIQKIMELKNENKELKKKLAN